MLHTKQVNNNTTLTVIIFLNVKSKERSFSFFDFSNCQCLSTLKSPSHGRPCLRTRSSRWSYRLLLCLFLMKKITCCLFSTSVYEFSISVYRSWVSTLKICGGDCGSSSPERKVWTTAGLPGKSSCIQSCWFFSVCHSSHCCCFSQGVVLPAVSWGPEPHVLFVWVCRQRQLLSPDQPCFLHQPWSPQVLQVHWTLHCYGNHTIF